MRFSRAVVIALLTGGSWCAPALVAQEAPPGLQIFFPPGSTTTLSSTDRPIVQTRGVLGGRKIRELLEHAFPARLHFHIERYKQNRWVDELRGAYDWDVVVWFDPTTRRYHVRRQQLGKRENLGVFGSIDEAAGAAEASFVVAPFGDPMTRGNSYYYAARLEVTALQVSDFDAVQGWLKGELQPAVRGRQSVFTALREGIATAITRVVGGDKRTYEARSPGFTIG